MNSVTAPLRILFATGGSGGHLFPALAVIEELRASDSAVEVGIVASEKGIDRAILAGRSERVWHLPSVSPSRIWQAPLIVSKDSWASLKAAKLILREFMPTVVVGCGGFASVPVVLAALTSRIPAVLLEQNLMPGRANAWLSMGARHICVSFEETRKLLPWITQSRSHAVRFTGNPVRREMTAASTAPREPRHLLVLGGSQGARHLNEAVTHWIISRPPELNGWTITHQTGASDLAEISAQYSSLSDFCQATAHEFIRDLLPYYQSATLVIARAGATSLAELACQGVPTILVPLPSAARNHQLYNARWYADLGAACLVQQADSPEATAGLLGDMFPIAIASANSLGHSILQAARPTSSRDVAEVIRSCGK